MNQVFYTLSILVLLFITSACTNITEKSNTSVLEKAKLYFLSPPPINCSNDTFICNLHKAAYLYSKNKLTEAKKLTDSNFNYCNNATDDEIAALLVVYLQITRAGNYRFNKKTVQHCLQYSSEHASVQLWKNLEGFYASHQVNKAPQLSKTSESAIEIGQNASFWTHVLVTNYPAFGSSIGEFNDVITLYDTGAESTLITPTLIKKLNLTYEKHTVPIVGILGQDEDRQVKIPQVTFGGNTIENIYALESYSFGEKSVVVLGLDVLKRLKTLKYTDTAVYFGDKSLKQLPNSMPLYFVNGTLCVLAKDNFGELLLLLDTGYNGIAMTNHRYYKERLDSKHKKILPVNIPSLKDINKKISRKDLPTVSFSFAEHTFQSIPIQYKEYEGDDLSLHAINLGSAFLTDHFSEYGFDFENMQFHYKLREKTISEQRKEFLQNKPVNN